MTTDADEDLDKRIDAIESAYEYFLAYAAQGRKTDRDAGGGERSAVREHLEKMASALDDLGTVARAVAALRNPKLVDDCAAFFAALDEDAAKARAAVILVTSQNDVSSQLIDNLNASIHVRAMLTDLFVVDEALKARSAE
jgi:hypothetical protein